MTKSRYEKVQEISPAPQAASHLNAVSAPFISMHRRPVRPAKTGSQWADVTFVSLR